jgi:hypothetical protein
METTWLHNDPRYIYDDSKLMLGIESSKLDFPEYVRTIKGLGRRM